LLGLAQFGPMLVLTVFVGHVADRYDHRRILLLCQVTEGLAAAILVYATATGALGTPVIYLVVAVVGSARAFEIPTMAAIISSLVRRAAAVADLRPRYPAGRAMGARPPALGAGDRRADHVDHPGAPAADSADRPRAVQRADDLWPRGHLFCLRHGAVAVDGGAGPDG